MHGAADIDDPGPRFMQPLILGFLHHFSIPVSFLKHLEVEFELESVVLRTEDEPQPQREWVVSVTGGRHFGNGWEDFCQQHHLQLGYFLVFTLESHFVFHVSVFHPLTASQIELRNTTQAPSATETPKEHPQFVSCYVTITASSFKRSVLYLPRGFMKSSGLLKGRSYNIKLIDEKAIPWLLKLSYKSNGHAYFCGGWKHFRIANCIRPRSLLRFQLIHAGMIPIFKCSSFNRHLEQGGTKDDYSSLCLSFLLCLSASSAYFQGQLSSMQCAGTY